MFARFVLFLALCIGAAALRTAPTMIFGWPMGGAKKASSPAAPVKAAPAKVGMTKAAPASKMVATKAAPAKAAAWQFGQGTQNKGTYIPEGLTKAQYDAQLLAEQKKKLTKKTKFPLGKEAETLTEWMNKEAKKGNVGKKLLYSGHRMVKAKYDGWYTDESPV